MPDQEPKQQNDWKILGIALLIIIAIYVLGSIVGGSLPLSRFEI